MKTQQLTKQQIQQNTKLLIQASQQGNTSEVEQLIPISDPNDHFGEPALCMATRYGHTEIVNLLIPVSNETVRYNALRTAVTNGQIDIFKTLLPALNPKNGDSYALQEAAKNGHTECLKLLIPVSDPKADDSSALFWAATRGHTECVELLLPVSDPKACDSKALWWAVYRGHLNIIKTLIPVSDYQFVIKELLDDNKDIALFQQCINEYEALQQKERLTIEVDQVVVNTHTSIKRKM